MHLVAVLRRGPRSVVADRQREEVEHEIRVGDLVVRADEASRLEVIRRAGPAAQEEPARADLRPPPLLQRRLHRHRLRRCVLDVDLEVILEVLADGREIVDDVDAEWLELARIADAR